MNSDKSTSQAQVGLASWLGGGSVFIVLLAVAAIAITCAILLNRLVQQQALVRAQLAVATARELLRRAGEDALSDARVLAERPTLQRLLESEPNSGLEPFLRRFSETTGTDVTALMRGDTALAQSGPAMDWPEIATALQEQGERFVVAPKDGGALIWGAAAAVPGTGVRAVTLRLTDQELLAKLGLQVGAQLRAVNFATYHAPPDDDMTPLHTRALANPGGAASGKLPGDSPYAATMVLAAQTGEVVGLLDARLSGAEFAAATRSFDWILGTTAIIVAAIAGLLGVLYGRWLARPVVALRELADRIGRGDFSTALPAVAPLEVGALARSMDEMRRNLVDLTDALRRREAEAQTVLSGVIEGVYAVDHERRIRYANAQVARLLGRPAGEIVGQFCGDVLQPAARQRRAAVRAQLPDPCGSFLAAGESARDAVPERRQHPLGDRAERARRCRACRCRSCATRPIWRPRAARATACWATSRTNFARRSPPSWPRSNCCATACMTCSPTPSASCSPTSSAACCA